MDNFLFETTCKFEKKELDTIVKEVSNVRMKSIDIQDFQKFSKIMILILMSYFLWKILSGAKYIFELIKFSFPVLMILRIYFLPILALVISIFLILNLKYQQFFMQKIYKNLYGHIFLVKNKYVITDKKIEYIYFYKTSQHMHLYFKDIRNVIEFKDNDTLILLFNNKSFLPIKLDKNSKEYENFMNLCSNRIVDYI